MPKDFSNKRGGVANGNDTERGGVEGSLPKTGFDQAPPGERPAPFQGAPVSNSRPGI